MGRRFLTLVVLPLVIFFSGCAERGVTTSESAHSSAMPVMAVKRPLEGVPNFTEVTPTLFRGGQPTQAGFENLATMGINIVVDVRGWRREEHDEVTRMGMEYLSIHWHCPFPRDEIFARFLKLLRDNPGKKIFIHCRLGDDRVGMMIAAFRMADQGWTAQQAMEEMKADGFRAAHHMLCPGLAGYERSFPQRYRTSPAFGSLRRTQHSK